MAKPLPSAEFQRTEAALLEANQAMRSLIQSYPAAIITLDCQGKVKSWNPAAENIFGWSESEVLGCPNPIIPEDKLTNSGASFQQALQGEVYSNLELLGQRQDGSLVDVSLSTAPLRDASGEIIGVMVVLADISSRKQAEKALQQLLKRERLLGMCSERIRWSLNLQEILETTVKEVRKFLGTEHVAIYRLESNGSGKVVVESVESGGKSMLGWTSDDSQLFTQNSLSSYQQDKIEAIKDIYKADLSDSQIQLLESFEIKAQLVIPLPVREQLWGFLIAHQCSGPRVWQSLEIDVLGSLAMQVAIAIGQSELYQQVQQLNTQLEQQVQERTVQLQQALRLEAMLKRITDKVRDSLDETHIWQTAVREVTEVLGVRGCNATLYDLEQGTSIIGAAYTQGRLVDQERVGRVAELNKFPELYEKQLLQGQYFQFCSLLPNSDRGRVAMLACPIFDDQGVLGDLWVINNPDYIFSELEIRLVQQVANQCAIALRQARLYQASQAQVEELQRLSRLKDDFVSAVSHELRTPMTKMKVAIQMLTIALKQAGVLSDPTDESTAISKKVADYWQIMQDECEREINLINDLLDWQRLEEDSSPFEPEDIDLCAFLPELVEPIVQRAASRQQLLELEIDPELPALKSEPKSLGRIVAELLNNACKYMPPGESIVLAACCKNRSIELSVTNYGTEIPPQEQSRIFERFYRIPKIDRWHQGGTGLGLALVQRLVTHLQGTIQVESAQGRTCFRVELPLEQKGREGEQRKKEKGKSESVNRF